MGKAAAPTGFGGTRAGGGLTRRQALIGGGTVALAGGRTAVAEAASGRVHASYPRVTIAKLASVRRNVPITFDYPLTGQASVLIDLGRAVPHGVGPKHSIVAYSVICQHMGCPVAYERSLREFVCPCHQSRYDPSRLGSIIQGVAMLPLPRVLLEVKNGAVHAVGVDGLIYGYRNNLHPGKRA